MHGFLNNFTSNLPGDPSRENIPRQVKNACYSFVTPTPVKNPQLVAWSDQLAAELGLSDLPLDILSGNRLPEGSQPYAARYGGHQFGHWAGQLGDGRAIGLGEIEDRNKKLWEIQLKGAGITPYSRHADGRAVLRSSLREFLCSEAMYHLGVPTTRALSLITTGEAVIRDMFYDGNPKAEPGAIVTRVAPTFIRFGNFEIHCASQENHLVKQLADYVIGQFHPELGPPSEEAYAKWFYQVCEATADLIVEWMRVGFVHGVMNTDNMSILGLTIDYGPYGFLEEVDFNWTPNTTDARNHRYAFGKQAEIAFWNLERLAVAIECLFSNEKPLVEGLSHFQSRYGERFLSMMRNKLGIDQWNEKEDRALIHELFLLLQSHPFDWTIFFRNLIKIPDEISMTEHGKSWIQHYSQRLSISNLSLESRQNIMNKTNPNFIFRNYIAKQITDELELGKNTMLLEFMQIMRHPYDDQPEYSRYSGPRPEWARNAPGCSMLSCSS